MRKSSWDAFNCCCISSSSKLWELEEEGGALVFDWLFDRYLHIWWSLTHCLHLEPRSWVSLRTHSFWDRSQRSHLVHSQTFQPEEMINSNTYLWIIRYKVDLRLAPSRQVAPSLVFGTLPACCTGILGFSTDTFLVRLFAIIALVYSQTF